MFPHSHLVISAPTTSARLVDQNNNQTNDDQDQKQDTLSPSRVCLVSSRFLQFAFGGDKLARCLLYVVFDRIENRTLLDD